MGSYCTVCFVAVMAICGLTVGCGGDAAAPVDTPPSVTEASGGSEMMNKTAEPSGADEEPAGSGSK